MNNSPHHARHLKKKAIHEANKMLEDGVEFEDSTPQVMDSHESECPSCKKHKKISKRTSPDNTPEEVVPASCHNEEPRWSQAKQSQTKENNLRLQHRLNHQKKKG